MATTAPNCRECGEKLTQYVYFCHATIDPERKKQFGYKGNGFFCTLRCGFRYAVNTLKRRGASEKSDLADDIGEALSRVSAGQNHDFTIGRVWFTANGDLQVRCRNEQEAKELMAALRLECVR